MRHDASVAVTQHDAARRALGRVRDGMQRLEVPGAGGAKLRLDDEVFYVFNAVLNKERLRETFELKLAHAAIHLSEHGLEHGVFVRNQRTRLAQREMAARVDASRPGFDRSLFVGPCLPAAVQNGDIVEAEQAEAAEAVPAEGELQRTMRLFVQ